MHSSLPATDRPRNKNLRIHVTEDEHARLRALADSQNRPMAEVVRNALRFTLFVSKREAGQR